MVMYMIASVIATVITEGIIFLGIYFYETEILAGEYLRIWGSTVEGHVNLDVLGASSSTGLNLFVFIAIMLLELPTIKLCIKYLPYCFAQKDLLR